MELGTPEQLTLVDCRFSASCETAEISECPRSRRNRNNANEMKKKAKCVLSAVTYTDLSLSRLTCNQLTGLSVNSRYNIISEVHRPSSVIRCDVRSEISLTLSSPQFAHGSFSLSRENKFGPNVITFMINVVYC